MGIATVGITIKLRSVNFRRKMKQVSQKNMKKAESKNAPTLLRFHLTVKTNHKLVDQKRTKKMIEFLHKRMK